ncbi:MAG: HAMP domain-containing sensor histidine kinase [Burkholderiaceae bacterium]
MTPRDIVRLERRARAIIDGYRGRPLEIERGDEIGSLTHAVNDMQRGLAERELRLELSRQNQFHREKMATIGGIAGGVAHEINNPIAAIQAAAESLQSRLDADRSDGAVHSLEAAMIIEQTARIASITRQLGDFATPRQADAGPVDLNEIVRSTCRFLAYDPRMRRIDLRLDLAPDLPAAHAVADHVVQTLMNLIINAADAISSLNEGRGTIEVGSQLRYGMVRFWVRDDGPGMTEEVAQRAFDEFFTTKGERGGTGIGLYLCRRLMAAHGGCIEFEPACTGGACFTVELCIDGGYESISGRGTAT